MSTFIRRRRSALTVNPGMANLMPVESPMSTPRSNAAEGLIRRVSTLFSSRKKSPLQASRPSRHSVDSLRSSTSTDTLASLGEIRRPSGLGPPVAAEIVAEKLPLEPRTRAISSPSLLHSLTLKAKPTPKLPTEVISTILTFLPRPHIPTLALISHDWLTAAQYVLYGTLDLRNITSHRYNALSTLLWSRHDLTDLTHTLICEKWMDFALPFQRMSHLTSLTLPNFDLDILQHHTAFGLTRIKFLDDQLDVEELMRWLDGQVNIRVLELPRLWEDGELDIELPSTLLPALHTLHAPPSLVELLSSRPLRRVTLNVDATLYTGLRPGTLMKGLGGVTQLRIQFSPKVDKRTVEKTLGSAGSVLGNTLESLAVEVCWTAQTLYKIIGSVLPRYRALHTLVVRSSSPSSRSPTSDVEEELVEDDNTSRIWTWKMLCPTLSTVKIGDGER